jgi:hypothetical protein
LQSSRMRVTRLIAGTVRLTRASEKSRQLMTSRF